MSRSKPLPLSEDDILDKAGIKARFLVELAMEGILLPPERAEAAASDFLALHQQIRLIRTVSPPDATFPLTFSPMFGDG